MAMLAVLKAGGAFVPLDPSHPIARLESLVQEVETKIVLCSNNHSAHLSTVAENVIAIDAEQLERFATADDAKESEYGSSLVKCTNAAYVLFTSGSTGKPKVSLIHKRQLICLK